MSTEQPPASMRPVTTDAEAEEIAALQAFGRELAAMEASPWEPTAVARAFARPQTGALVFTLETWLTLSHLRSPLLRGLTPETADGAEDMLRAFGVKLTDGDADEQAIELWRRMEEALTVIAEGFAMLLPMAPESPPPKEDQGFGLALTLVRLLMTELHCGRVEALRTPVGQAHALLASARDGQGWACQGVTYRLRDLGARGEGQSDNLTIGQSEEGEARG